MAPGSSKEIFVGNIPFNLSEEQITGILNTVGQVTSFRLMTDSGTGKPRGYGFATYADPDQAASAVRNLNDYEVGGRKIRVDWPHQQNKDAADKASDGDMVPPDGAYNGQAAQTALPPLPPGVELPPNLKATDAISQTLSQLPPQTLLDILTQMKSLAISEPAKTTELLRQQPQLSYAIFQALLLMGLVDEKIFQQVLDQPQRPAAVVPPPMAAQPPPIPPPHQTPHPQYPPMPQQHPQYPGYPPPPIPGQQMPGVGMPPRVMPPYGAPPPPYPPPQQQLQQQPPPVQAPPQPDQNQLLQQILAMDQRTIDSLPETEKQQVLQIRAQMGVR
ncbi:hypothetical protein LTS08_003912 [Lithohypha guttulata]|uniref:uncharacterized protein n=1 Tax=Lithohypha guttulata TaxID=1690604 RepID=UPI002DDE399C|nr:hypothetical protein LTR51_001130 [Lithohypha guttulata]KAK5103109.1 hypothetical protein LTS08_003912 [Lithohypha guttulata]